MKNREVFQVDPSARKLVNEGVATVNDDRSKLALQVLRYELETFVCDGQYEKGMEHILDTYLKNINEAQQPAVWVSGFFGSGKSHLIKMLRALWTDTELENGATARSTAILPKSILDLLKELSTQGKRHGGLHAASGTLGSGDQGSVRKSLLGIVFKSAGLPERYSIARFVMWLKKQGIYDEVRQYVEGQGIDWHEEIEDLYVAELLHEALMSAKPDLFATPELCAQTLNNMFPHEYNVTSDEMIKAIREAVSQNGKFPLTLIVLDEVQQYIGDDAQKSMDVQEAVEACCKGLGGKLLFVATGQTALAGSSNLRRLEGRFTSRIELSDADVDAVVRKVILQKKPDKIKAIDQIVNANLGEISRHLSNSPLGHRMDDTPFLTADYPVLPVRRRFWENALRVLDQTGTASQLRNQLSMVHKAVQECLDSELGHVIAADYLYFDIADKLLQARMLPRKVHEKTMSWMSGSDDERLMARACGLVFLINKLKTTNTELGLMPNVDTIADLMVEDLAAGSAGLRARLPQLLDQCELTIKVSDEYRIQTEESAAWNDAFENHRAVFNHKPTLIDSARVTFLKERLNEIEKKINLTQGSSKVPRTLNIIYNTELPVDKDNRMYIWIRDGWLTDEASVLADARSAGNNSPTIFGFIPRRSADELRNQLLDLKAAEATLEQKGVPVGDAGQEARAAIETIRITAQARIGEILSELLSSVRIFQGGGQEIVGDSLAGMIKGAAENSMTRLYREFAQADDSGWAKVYSKAREGALDALKGVNHTGEVLQQPVCKTLFNALGPGKKGSDLQKDFEGPPYGWSRDAIEGGLQVLLLHGLIKAVDERNQVIEAGKLERKQIGKTTFKVEATTISAAQRIQIRKVLQNADIACNPNEEYLHMSALVQKLQTLAQAAGGAAPRPEMPDMSMIENIRLCSGNEQLLAVFNQKDIIPVEINKWKQIAAQIKEREEAWHQLQMLVAAAQGSEHLDNVEAQMQAIIQERLLLADPDPISPLIKTLEGLIRSELNAYYQTYQQIYLDQQAALQDDPIWKQLSTDEQDSIAEKAAIKSYVSIDTSSLAAMLSTLKQYPLQGWKDRIAALEGRIKQAREMAAKLLEPQTQTIKVPRPVLKDEAAIDNWLAEIRTLLKEAVTNGPVIIE